ncbi:MAG: hypothetical protein CMD18_03110 [Flavobacteriales bacterium]|nr:hypothetical protein [Flavobacteriales bacterium]
MFCIINRLTFLLFVFVFPFSIFSQNSDSLQSNSFIDLKEKLKQALVLADHLEHSSKYIEAYMKYTEVGKMASAAGKLDYAIDLYIVAITLREKYNLKIPHSYDDRNLAFLNLCNHLRQNMNDKSVFWHQVAINQTEVDADTLTMLKLYKSFALYYMDKYDNENAIRINKISLPISHAFGDTIEYAINLLDFSDLLNKEGRFESADSISDIGYKLIHDFELRNDIMHSTKWSFWFIQLKAFIYFNQGDFKKSEQFYLACIDSIKGFQDRGGIKHADLEYVTNIRLGKLYYELGNYKSANILFLASDKILGNPNNIGFNKSFLYDNMLQTYQRAGLYKKAFEVSEKYRIYIDQLNREARKQHDVFLKDIDLLHLENDEKELEILRQEKHQESKDAQLTYLGIGIFVVCLVALLLFFFNQRQNRTNKQLLKMNSTIAEQRDQITASIEYAKKIQKAILPSEELMKICLPFSYVFYEPRDIVSGDFYWVHSIGEKVLVACADSTGHGVPGAIVSMIGNNGLNTCVNEYGLTKPSQILDALNKYVEETFDKSIDAVNDGMDIALCLFDFEKNEVEYSGANIPLYLVQENELIVTKADKQPIGRYFYRKPFTNHVINLTGVNNIYMCSDGIQDQFGGYKGKKFKIRRLKRLLVELSHHEIKKQKGMLNETFLDWKKDEEQVDDVCFIGINVKNSS